MYGEHLYGETLYGLLETTSKDIEKFIPNLMWYLPKYYRKDKGSMHCLQQKAIAPEIGQLKFLNEELLAQFFIDTATWGLDLWEKELEIQTDRSKPFERRREIIKAKLRGAGTTTVEMIKNVAEAFSGGEVIVIEEPNEAHFILRFVGTVGIPPNMAGLTKAIEDIKPAHLAFMYEFTWSWWTNLTDKNLTWNGASTYSWDDIRIYGLEE